MEEPRSDTMPMAGVRIAQPCGESAAFEAVYLRFAPLLRKIAVAKYGIPAADVEPLIHDVFATYLTRAEEVENVERYLIGGICNASRYYQRRDAADGDLFCGEEPCAAAPTDQRAEIAAHLAECAACQQTSDSLAVNEEVLEAELRDSMTCEPVVGSETMRTLTEWGERVAEEDREAAELLKEYLEKQISAAWQLLMTKRRLRTGGVVRALIRAAHGKHEDDALAALTFADNAIAIAEGLDDERYPHSAADQLRATAWKERANAQILLGRFAAAHRSLDSAERFHRRYTPNGLGLAIVTIVRAGLFYAQECFDEATTLAECAERGFALAGEEKRRMDAVFLRANIMMHAGRPSEARALFQQTIQYAAEARDLRLLARNSNALGNCEVDLGNLDEASIHFHRALVISRELGPAVRRIETEWGIARIVLHGGRYEDAVRRLGEIATEFERLKMVTQAAYVGIDIMEGHLALNKPGRVVALAQHLISTFSKAGMLTGVLSVIDHYLRDCFRRKTRATVGELAAILGCHPDYLTRTAGSMLGASLLDYFRSRQIEEAERLITVTTLSMNEIALRAGFGTVSTFYRHFREAHGMSPGAFRKVRK